MYQSFVSHINPDFAGQALFGDVGGSLFVAGALVMLACYFLW